MKWDSHRPAVAHNLTSSLIIPTRWLKVLCNGNQRQKNKKQLRFFFSIPLFSSFYLSPSSFHFFLLYMLLLCCSSLPLLSLFIHQFFLRCTSICYRNSVVEIPQLSGTQIPRQIDSHNPSHKLTQPITKANISLPPPSHLFKNIQYFPKSPKKKKHEINSNQ